MRFWPPLCRSPGYWPPQGWWARVVAIGIDLNADASVLVGIGVSGVPVVQFLSGVVWGNLSSAVSFAVLAWTGLLLRRRPAAHKRLMLLATIAILGPALARLARLPYFGGEGGPFVLIVTFALLGVVIVHDVATMRRRFILPPFLESCSPWGCSSSALRFLRRMSAWASFDGCKTIRYDS